jgi:hypothetical protein
MSELLNEFLRELLEARPKTAHLQARGTAVKVGSKGRVRAKAPDGEDRYFDDMGDAQQWLKGKGVKSGEDAPQQKKRVEKKPSDSTRKGAPQAKNKELSPSARTIAVFNTESKFAGDGVSDSEFNGNPKRIALPKSTTPKELEKFFVGKDGNVKFPRKYIKVLARLLSTSKKSAMSISDFTDASGAGTLSSTMGELLSMTGLAIDDDAKAEEFFSFIEAKVKEASSASIIDRAWVKSAREGRIATRKHWDAEYGQGNWSLASMAWDIKDEVEALGLHDYKKNKGFSTDTYAKLVVNGKPILDEISLKKDLAANLLNATTGRVTDILVRGRASPEDYEEYEDICAQLDAIAGNTSSVAKKERQKLIQQQTALIKKYVKDLPDDVLVDAAVEKQSSIYSDFLNDDAALTEVSSLLNELNSTSIIDLASEIDAAMNQNGSYTKKIAQQLQKLLDMSPNTFKGDPLAFAGIVDSIVGGSTKDRNKFMLAIMHAVRISRQGKSSRAGTYINELTENSHRHSKAVRNFLMTNKEARTGLLKSIRDAFPLRALFEGEENMVLGKVVATRKVLVDIFGTEDFSEIEQQLTVRDEPPPPAIVYRAAGKKDIPIAEIATRPDGIGYSESWKLIMGIHPDFKKSLIESNKKIFG